MSAIDLNHDDMLRAYTKALRKVIRDANDRSSPTASESWLAAIKALGMLNRAAQRGKMRAVEVSDGRPDDI